MSIPMLITPQALDRALPDSMSVTTTREGKMLNHKRCDIAVDLIARIRKTNGVHLSIVGGQAVGTPDEQITPEIDASVRELLPEIATALAAELLMRRVVARARRNRRKDSHDLVAGIRGRPSF